MSERQLNTAYRYTDQHAIPGSRSRTDCFSITEEDWKNVRRNESRHGFVIYSADELERQRQIDYKNLLERSLAKIAEVENTRHETTTRHGRAKLRTHAASILAGPIITLENLAKVPEDYDTRADNSTHLEKAPVKTEDCLDPRKSSEHRENAEYQDLRPPRSLTAREAARVRTTLPRAPELSSNIHECYFRENEDSHDPEWKCSMPGCFMTKTLMYLHRAPWMNPRMLRDSVSGFAVPNGLMGRFLRQRVTNHLRNINFHNDLNVPFNRMKLVSQLDKVRTKENKQLQKLHRDYVKSVQIVREATRREWAATVTDANAEFLEEICQLHVDIKDGCQFPIYSTDERPLFAMEDPPDPVQPCGQKGNLHRCLGTRGRIRCNRVLCPTHSSCDSGCRNEGPRFSVTERYRTWDTVQAQLLVGGNARKLTDEEYEALSDFPDDNFVLDRHLRSQNFVFSRGCPYPSATYRADPARTQPDYYPQNTMRLDIHRVGWNRYVWHPHEPLWALARDITSDETLLEQVYDVQLGLNLWWKRKVHERLGVAASWLARFNLPEDIIKHILLDSFHPPRRFWTRQRHSSDPEDDDSKFTLETTLQGHLNDFLRNIEAEGQTEQEDEEEDEEDPEDQRRWRENQGVYMTHRVGLITTYLKGVEFISYQPTEALVEKAITLAPRLLFATYRPPRATLDAAGILTPDTTKPHLYHTKHQWKEQLRSTNRKEAQLLPAVARALRTTANTEEREQNVRYDRRTHTGGNRNQQRTHRTKRRRSGK